MIPYSQRAGTATAFTPLLLNFIQTAIRDHGKVRLLAAVIRHKPNKYKQKGERKMAEERLIRKKFNTTIAECLVVDLETGKSSTIKVPIKGLHKYDEKKLLREVKRSLPAEVKCLKITGIEIKSEQRVISEDFFYANSKKVN